MFPQKPLMGERERERVYLPSINKHIQRTWNHIQMIQWQAGQAGQVNVLTSQQIKETDKLLHSQKLSKTVTFPWINCKTEKFAECRQHTRQMALLTSTKPRVLALKLAKRFGSSTSLDCSLTKPWRCRKSSWRLNDNHQPDRQTERRAVCQAIREK